MAASSPVPSPLPPEAVPPLTVAVTGAGGALGRALLRRWHERGARLIALTSGEAPLVITDRGGHPIPLRQVRWQVGEEGALATLLDEVDVLVINHGVNVYRQRSAAATALSLEVNALSAWRLLELFAERVAQRQTAPSAPRRARPEVWVNTSEAEVQPALSPLYEISKRLIGELVSLRSLDLNQPGAGGLRIRRLVLGPFRSALNPFGVMGADWVAGEILRQADWDWGLILVTPNPFTWVTMPLTALGRALYFGVITRNRGSGDPAEGDPANRDPAGGAGEQARGGDPQG